jgi:hypothetical protein
MEPPTAAAAARHAACATAVVAALVVRTYVLGRSDPSSTHGRRIMI